MELDRTIVPIDVIVAILQDSFLFGTRTVAVELRSVEHTVGSRIARLLITSNTEVRRVVAKTYLRRTTSWQKMADRVLSEFHFLRRVHEAMSGELGLGVARPIVCFPDLLTTVTEEVEGTTIHRLMNSHASRFSSANQEYLMIVLERVGLWVKKFQHLLGATGTVSFVTMREELERSIAGLVDAGRALSYADGNRILNKYDYLWAHVSPQELAAVPVHGDFNPSNILVSGVEVTVLDFGESRSGAQFEDVALLCLHFKSFRYRPWIDPGIIKRACSAVLRGMNATISSRCVLYQLAMLNHKVRRLTILQNCSVPSFVRRYLEECLRDSIRRQCSEEGGEVFLH